MATDILFPEGIDNLMRECDFKKALLHIDRMLENDDCLQQDKEELLYRRGKCLFLIGEFHEALDVFKNLENSISTTNQTGNMEGRLKAAIGVTTYELSCYDLAFGELTEAYELLRETGENHEVANVQKYLGWYYVRRGRLKKAKEYLEDSISSFRRLGEFIEIAKVKNDLAHICFLKAEWTSAIEYLEDAIQIRRSAKMFKGVFVYLTNLGSLHLFLGDFGKSLHCYKKSMRLAARYGDDYTTTHNSLMIGKLYLHKHVFRESQEWLTRGLKLATEKGMKREIAIGHEYLGELAFEQGDYEKAELYYEEAREIAEAIAPEGDLINELYRRIADLKVRTGDSKKAWKASERALAVSKSLGDRFEEALTIRVRGMVLKEEGKTEEALEHLNQCLTTLTSLGEKYEAARTNLEIGIMLSEQMESEESLIRAGQHLKQAKELFEELGLDYYLGEVAIEMATVHVALGEDKKVLECLNDAADFDKNRADRDAKIIRVRDIKRSLEEAIVERVISASDEISPLTEVTTTAMGYSSNTEGLEKIFFYLMKRIKADRGFIARRDGTRGDFMVSISKGLAIPQSEAILNHIKGVDGRILSAMRPYLSLDVPGDSRLAPIRNDMLPGIDSLAAVPFGVKGDVEGICYLDRETGLHELPILFDGLKRIVSFSKYMAHFVVAIERDELRSDNRYLRRQLRSKLSFDDIITQDPEMLELLRTVERLKDSNIQVLLLGETGTGKELFARAIHFSGMRKNRQYVAVNCAAIPDNLLESELFGHKKGSFTGATMDKKGLLEVANRGTFFLDEIADMGLAIQVKLLRFLESGELMRLGDTTTRKVNVRIVAATNKDLEAEIDAGRFREDLFYRLDGITLPIPPLRNRRADIPILISHFIEKYCAEEKRQVKGVASNALNLLVSYDWPGNVRELLNEIRRAVTLAEDGDEIGLELLSSRVKRQLRGGSSSSDAKEAGSTLPELMASFERQRIFMALKEAHWVKTRAAKQLGIHEATLRGKMRRYGLENPTRDD